MKKILLDASSAILIFKSGLLGLLMGLYEIYMAESVYKELTHDGYPGAKEFMNWLAEKRYSLAPGCHKPIVNGKLSQETATLHRGELDTIWLYEKGYGNFIMTDDGNAASYCKSQHIPFINALLFPKVLFSAQKITEYSCTEKMRYILKIGRYSPEIINWAKSCPKESLDFFLP